MEESISRVIEKFIQDFSEEVETYFNINYLFNFQITIYSSIPSWLWGGNRTRSHPSIRIKHNPPIIAELPETSTQLVYTQNLICCRPIRSYSNKEPNRFILFRCFIIYFIRPD